MNRHKGILSWLLVILVLGLVGVAAYFVLEPQIRPHVTVHLGDAVFKTPVAKTEAEREQGLGGTHGLGEDQGMLFVYDHDDKWAIWMKDMNYPIDIVWLDKDKKVVYIVKNAPPESYPYQSFTPKQEARYVIELAAGTVDKKKITVGTVGDFDENNIEGLKL